MIIILLKRIKKTFEMFANLDRNYLIKYKEKSKLLREYIYI